MIVLIALWWIFIGHLMVNSALEASDTEAAMLDCDGKASNHTGMCSAYRSTSQTSFPDMSAEDFKPIGRGSALHRKSYISEVFKVCPIGGLRKFWS